MAALWNRAGHYIFVRWFLSSSSFFFFLLLLFFPRLISAAVDWMSTMHAARWKCRTQKSPKIGRLGTISQLCRAISSQPRHTSTIGKKLVKEQYLPTCPCNMVNFGFLAAEIVSLVWGTPANLNGFRVVAALLHDTLVVGVSQTAALNRGRHL